MSMPNNVHTFPLSNRCLFRTFCVRLMAVFALLFSVSDVQGEDEPGKQTLLSPRNTQAPFCYLTPGVREWPITVDDFAEPTKITLQATQGEKTLASGTELSFSGLKVQVTPQGRLRIESAANSPRPVFSLKLSVLGEDETSQILSVRAAPPARPIEYVSDLVDDLIRIFWDQGNDQFQPVTRDAFDQYFRRLQAHGVKRLIVWQSPFPFMCNADDYAAEDWQRYAGQAKAIVENEELATGMKGKPLSGWKWLRMVLALRMNSEFGKLYTQSAHDHGIQLTASFRPFEPALTKYYDLPAFDGDGKWLWGFLPLGSPAVTYHSEDVCFANVRTILKSAKAKSAAQVSDIVLNSTDAKRVINSKESLHLVSSPFPPIDDESFVLQRDQSKQWKLKKYREVKEATLKHQLPVEKLKLAVDDSGSLQIQNIQVPNNHRYLIISWNKDEPAPWKADATAVVRSEAGNRLGRTNWYHVFPQEHPAVATTRIAGISSTGSFRTTFQTIENSIGASLKAEKTNTQIVIDLGANWSVEMLDFERPRARELAVGQLKSMLRHAAFDEIFLNTRSHCQLGASMADGDLGVRPIREYRTARKNYRHLGIDRAFAPISLAKNPRIRELAGNNQTIEQLTHWQPGEWDQPCQSADSPYAWRYARNQAIANGVRQLCLMLSEEFPATRIRMVIPPSAAVINNVKLALDEMPKPDGGTYGSGYYRHIWGSLNHIPAIGEATTMVDLTGTAVEPVFLGIRFAPDDGPLNQFLNESFADMTGNRGSSYQGPRSFFYEAQETLRSTASDEIREKRNAILCKLLSHEKQIKNVVLYESADWLYSLPLDDPAQCNFEFLDSCSGAKTSPSNPGN